VGLWKKDKPKPKLPLLKHKGKMREVILEALSHDELLVLTKALIEDFEMLNQLHNDRAEQVNWCDIYEHNQAAYNARLKVFQLQPRRTRRQGSMEYADNFARHGTSLSPAIRRYYGSHTL